MSFYNKYPTTNLSQPNMRWIILQIKKLLAERRVKSINGEDGELQLKTINGNDILGDGDIRIQGTDVTDEHIREVAQTETILTALASKADAADISAIRDELNNKADLSLITELEIALSLKADKKTIDDILDESQLDVWSYTFSEATTAFEINRTPDGNPFHYKSLLYEFKMPAQSGSASPSAPIYALGDNPETNGVTDLYTFSSFSYATSERYTFGRVFNYRGIWRIEHYNNISSRAYVPGYPTQSMPNYSNATSSNFKSITGLRGGNFSAGGIPAGTVLTMYGIKDMRYYEEVTP